jgi:uncharacterized protein YydD (DUF2326 family)
MIHRLWASDPRFKTLSFGPGLNILLADRHEQATDSDTRNGVGKSSFVLLLHFLLGGNAGKSSLFTTGEIGSWRFGLDFDLGRSRTTVERTGAASSKFLVASAALDNTGQLDVGPGHEVVNQSDWLGVLRRTWFRLEGEAGPSARSLLSYFMRRVEDGGFQDPFKHNYQQSPSDYQPAVSFLLDLDWRLAERWEDVRQQEKTVHALANALKEGRLGSYAVGSVAKLRTQVTLAEERVEALRSNIAEFRLVESFNELEREANAIGAAIRRLSDENTMDRALVEQLQTTYETETPPRADELTEMYEAAGVQLGDLIRRRFDEVAVFHESIVQNRARHLAEELSRAEQRIAQREAEQRSLDVRRGEILRTLQTGGALAELTGLQEELAKAKARLEELRASYKVADQLAVGKAGVKRARQELLVQLQEDQREREPQLGALIRRFEELSGRLYDERIGSLEIGASENGPTFSIEIEAGKSKGINNMQVFCFDLLVAEVCSRRGLGPGFLVHDSHLFDGVDERQVGRGLALADEISTLNGFQYIVTMNSDAMPATVPDGFVPSDHVLDVQLTDTVDDGGLFGFRF